MNILFVSVRPPLPSLGGAALRGYNFIKLLGLRHRIHLVCYGTVREELALRDQVGDACATVKTVPPGGERSVWDRAAGFAASAVPDMVERTPTAALYQAVSDAARLYGPDLVHVLGLESAPAVFGEEGTAVRRAKVVIDELNAEYLLQRRAFKVARRDPLHMPEAGYSLVQAVKLRRYEQRICALADAVIAVSDEDQSALRRIARGKPIFVVPNGVDVAHYQPRDRAPQPSIPDVPKDAPVLLFTGTMSFRPNVDAVMWFAEAILPTIQWAIPEVWFIIAGRDPAPTVRDLAGPRVIVTGGVPDDLPYFHRASVFVLPMRFGGGTRLKLLQAFACGLPIVSTTAGASGLRLMHGEHALLADDPGLFVYYTIGLLRDPNSGLLLGLKGRALAEGFDWRAIVPRLESAYEQTLARPSVLRR